MWRSYQRKGVHEELQDDGGDKYENLKEDFLSDTSQDDHALEDWFDSQFKHEIHVNTKSGSVLGNACKWHFNGQI